MFWGDINVKKGFICGHNIVLSGIIVNICKLSLEYITYNIE